MCHIGGAQIVSSKSAATQESANWYVSQTVSSIVNTDWTLPTSATT